MTTHQLLIRIFQRRIAVCKIQAKPYSAYLEGYSKRSNLLHQNEIICFHEEKNIKNLSQNFDRYRDDRFYDRELLAFFPKEYNYRLLNALLFLLVFSTFSIRRAKAEEKKNKQQNDTESDGAESKYPDPSNNSQMDQKDRRVDQECIIQTPEALKKRSKKIGFREQRIIEYENRLRAYSTPDKLFRYFATLKLVYEDGSFDIFMTPEDFVRSLTPGVMQPRRLGLDKFRVHRYNEFVGKNKAKNEARMLQWIDDSGLINFGDYLFLMTILATSPSEFRLAFHVYDVNGDGELDSGEFEKVQELILAQSNIGQRHRDHTMGIGSFTKSKTSAISRHFFGEDGKQKMNIETFLKFQKDLHQDILRIEFERRDPETGPSGIIARGIISETQFADLLLIHASLSVQRRKRMMKRVVKRYKGAPNRKGVSFDEVNDFFLFLYHIDKVDLALHFFKLAGQPLTKDLLRRVARRVTGVQLSDTVLDVVVTLFDENGDGQLSQHEFVAVMKHRMQRGLERPKDTGLVRLLNACWSCGKKQLSALVSTAER